MISMCFMLETIYGKATEALNKRALLLGISTRTGRAFAGLQV